MFNRRKLSLPDRARMLELVRDELTSMQESVNLVASQLVLLDRDIRDVIQQAADSIDDELRTLNDLYQGCTEKLVKDVAENDSQLTKRDVMAEADMILGINKHSNITKED